MKRWIGLLVLSLLGCVPQPSQYPYRVSEVQLFFPNTTERWDIFYGEPQVVKLGNQALSLTQSQTPLVPNALVVNGQSAWRETVPVQSIARASRVFPGLQYAVRSRKDIADAWLYDGSWSHLGSGFKADETKLTTIGFGAPGFENLSTEETEAVLKDILNRRAGQPVVIYTLEPPLTLNLFDPSPNRYTTTALAIQYGIDTEFAVSQNQPPKVLLQGANAAYTQTVPAAYLASNAAQFQTVWDLATGNQTPQPAKPTVSFGQKRVAAFFWGQKTSGGYGVQYGSSQTNGSTLQVTLTLRSPAAGSITTQALTSPFLVLEVAAGINRVVFTDSSGRTLAQASLN